jgi:hypothetical protein
VRVLSRHPFAALAVLGLAALALLALAVLPLDRAPGRVLVLLLHTAGAGFYGAANLLARHAPWLPGWLDASLVVALGAAPYLAADVLWRRGVRALTGARRRPRAA